MTGASRRGRVVSGSRRSERARSTHRSRRRAAVHRHRGLVCVVGTRPGGHARRPRAPRPAAPRCGDERWGRRLHRTGRRVRDLVRHRRRCRTGRRRGAACARVGPLAGAGPTRRPDGHPRRIGRAARQQPLRGRGQPSGEDHGCRARRTGPVVRHRSRTDDLRGRVGRPGDVPAPRSQRPGTHLVAPGARRTPRGVPPAPPAIRRGVAIAPGADATPFRGRHDLRGPPARGHAARRRMAIGSRRRLARRAGRWGGRYREDTLDRRGGVAGARRRGRCALRSV